MEKKLKALLRLKSEHNGTLCAFQKHNSKDYVLLAEDAVEFRQRMDTGRRLRTCNGVKYITLPSESLNALIEGGMRKILYMNMM